MNFCLIEEGSACQHFATRVTFSADESRFWLPYLAPPTFGFPQIQAIFLTKLKTRDLSDIIFFV